MARYFLNWIKIALGAVSAEGEEIQNKGTFISKSSLREPFGGILLVPVVEVPEISKLTMLFPIIALVLKATPISARISSLKISTNCLRGRAPEDKVRVYGSILT